MKKILFALVLLPFWGVSQTKKATKYILIDRTYNRPALFADTVSKDMIRQGYFPIFYNDFDSAYSFIDKVKGVGKLGVDRVFLDNNDYKASHTRLDIVSVQGSYGDKYDIDIISDTDFGIYKLRMSNAHEDIGRNKYAIKTFFNYLTRTKKDIEKQKK